MADHHHLNRRLFLSRIGKGTLALAVLGTGVVACSGDPEASTGDTGSPGSDPGSTTDRSNAPAGTETTAISGGEEPAANGSLAWERVSFGFVSAYVLLRGNEVAIVDTGTAGNADKIEQALSALSRNWADVNHVVLTHAHGDHVGGLDQVLMAAPNAIGYAGAGDVEAITAPRDLVSVSGGDEVFGLRILATPGHTPGHISVFDPDSGLLVAGDALITDSNGLQGPSGEFSDDLDLAHQSVKALSGETVSTILVGHGDPITSDAGQMLSDLAASL